MKTTTLYKVHKNSGAKMIPFAGFMMPIQYSGLIKEHMVVRNKVGLFDVSHMGNIFVEGEQAESFLQYVTSNDVSNLSDRKVQYTYFPNAKAGIIDDLLLYKFSKNKFMLVVNASNIEKDINHLEEENKRFGTQIINNSEAYTILALQGPDSKKVIAKIFSEDIVSMPYYAFKNVRLEGLCDDLLISNTGYTGAGGYEIYVANQYAQTVWKTLMDNGLEFGITPVGLGARDTLRLEMGYCLYGNDIDQDSSPFEAGLGWVTKMDKLFIGKEELLKQKQKGLKRKLVGLLVKDRGIPRKGYLVEDTQGAVIGKITSGTISPVLNKAIAMAYIDKEHAKVGSTVLINIRNKPIKAELVSFPFIKT